MNPDSAFVPLPQIPLEIAKLLPDGTNPPSYRDLYVRAVNGLLPEIRLVGHRYFAARADLAAIAAACGLTVCPPGAAPLDRAA